MRRAAGLLVVLGAVALLAGGCGSHGRATLFVVGDSLVFQAQPSLLELAGDRGWTIESASLGGTSPCQWFHQTEDARDRLEPDVVVFSFAGNALAPCMQNDDGSSLTDEQYADRYRHDTLRLIELAGTADIYLVGAPAMLIEDDRVAGIFRSIADSERHVTFVDGGRYVTPDGRWVPTLPCLPDEPCTGPVVDGVPSNVVRSPDTVHFCPVPIEGSQACPVYSSGAYRFAKAIVEAVGRPGDHR